MMTAQPLEEDGALQPALAALEVAVDALSAPMREYRDSRLLITPSLYLQLRDAVTGEQVNTGGGGGSKSRPPFWTNAFDLLREIDEALEIWQPAYNGVPASVGRLQWLLQRKWRPQDTNRIEQLAAHLRDWAVKIDNLLNPQPKWTLPNPCPACGTAVVYRPDECGVPIRQPALHIGKDGCQCQSCRYIWEPARFQLLAGALGYPLPPGVLE